MGTPREQFFARNLCILLRFFGPTQSLCLKYVSIVYRWRLQLQGPRGPVPVRVSSHGLLFQCLLLKFFNNSLIYYLHISPSFVKSPYTAFSHCYLSHSHWCCGSLSNIYALPKPIEVNHKLFPRMRGNQFAAVAEWNFIFHKGLVEEKRYHSHFPLLLQS